MGVHPPWRPERGGRSVLYRSLLCTAEPLLPPPDVSSFLGPAFRVVETQMMDGDGGLRRALVFIPKVSFPAEWFKNNSSGIPSSTEVRMFVNTDFQLITSPSVLPWAFLRPGQGSATLSFSLRPNCRKAKGPITAPFPALTVSLSVPSSVGFLVRTLSLFSCRGHF